MAVCPSQCIYIETAEDEEGRRYPLTYELDATRCIFCGFCEEACPVKAIFMGKTYEWVEGKKSVFSWTPRYSWRRKKFNPIDLGNLSPWSEGIKGRGKLFRPSQLSPIKEEGLRGQEKLMAENIGAIFQWVVFLGAAFTSIIASLLLITRKNPIHSALFLVLTFSA